MKHIIARKLTIIAKIPLNMANLLRVLYKYICKQHNGVGISHYFSEHDVYLDLEGILIFYNYHHWRCKKKRIY
jgi:hypothetical protein